jgi:Leucine-rich repeat (LRR) protein
LPASNRSRASRRCSESTWRERGSPALRGLTALRSLDLAQTPVTSLDPLRGLTALQLLDLTGTQIPSLKPIYDLPELRLRNAGNLAEEVLTPFVQYRKERQLP